MCACVCESNLSDHTSTVSTEDVDVAHTCKICGIYTAGASRPNSAAAGQATNMYDFYLPNQNPNQHFNLATQQHLAWQFLVLWRSMPRLVHQNLWLPQRHSKPTAIGTFPILQTSRGFAIQYLRSKTSATFTKWNSLPASPLFCRPRVFKQELSVGRTSNSSEVCTVIQHVHAEAEVTYVCKLSQITSERIVFMVFPGCSMTLSCLELLILDLPKITPSVSRAFVCMTGTSSSVTSAELDPNQAAQQLWRSNRAW